MTETILRPIQGLLPAKNACEYYWSLKAKIELSTFIRIDVESLEKERKKPHPNRSKKER